MLEHCVVEMHTPDMLPTVHVVSEPESLPIVIVPPSEATRFGLRIAVKVLPS
jgi:hypothetical protein